MKCEAKYTDVYGDGVTHECTLEDDHDEPHSENDTLFWAHPVSDK